VNTQDTRVVKDAIAELRKGDVAPALARLERLLPVKRGPRPLPGRSTAREDRAARQQARREEMSALRAEAEKRADGRCECGCGAPLLLVGQLDHMLSGSGRRREQQSPQNTWMLTPGCHDAKTRNAPSAAYWWARFDAHCERNGLPLLGRRERPGEGA
jgi:5-methylcytosine-specific restriction endonuclease McrA